MAKSDSEGRAPKRVALNMKATPALRARIEEAAKESGLSIAQEVERRLIISMNNDDQAGGVIQGDMIRAILIMMNGTTRALGAEWWTDFDGWKIVSSNILDFLRDLRPEQPPEPAPFDAQAIAEYEARREGWYERVIKPLTDERKALRTKKIGGELAGFTQADEDRLTELTNAINESQRKGPEQPNLPPDELTRWEVERQRQYRLRHARNHSVVYVPSWNDDPTDYDYGA